MINPTEISLDLSKGTENKSEVERKSEIETKSESKEMEVLKAQLAQQQADFAELKKREDARVLAEMQKITADLQNQVKEIIRKMKVKESEYELMWDAAQTLGLGPERTKMFQDYIFSDAAEYLREVRDVIGTIKDRTLCLDTVAMNLKYGRLLNPWDCNSVRNLSKLIVEANFKNNIELLLNLEGTRNPAVARDLKANREMEERVHQLIHIEDGFEKARRIINHVLETPAELEMRKKADRAKCMENALYSREIERMESYSKEHGKGSCVIL